MTAADIAYVDHDPLIPTHLGTDAPHVHIRSSDRCLRRPEGVECLSPAELRAEVERLRSDLRVADVGKSFHALAVKDRDYERVKCDRLTAERDALQQRLANVQALAESLSVNSHAIGDEGECTYCGVPKEECGVWLVLAALGGPAAPPRWDEETDALFVDAARRAAPPQEPQPSSGILGGTVFEPARRQEPQPTPEAVKLCLSRHGDWFQHVAGRQPCVTCRHDAARQSEPVERITDANGDETERGADTDTENTHQQDGDHR